MVMIDYDPNVLILYVSYLGETGHCFLSTKPVILMCNMKLKKGQTKIGWVLSLVSMHLTII